MASKNYKPPLNETAPTKRSRTDSGEDSELPLRTYGIRFLVMTGTDEENPLKKLSPFMIYKGVQGIADKSVDIKRLNSGDILLKVTKHAHAENFLNCTSFVDVPVKVTNHRSLNSCKGVVRDRDLADSPPEQIIKYVEHVIDVKRIISKRNGVPTPTNTLILTFDTPVLPKKIRAGYLEISVSPYIPSPLRCFECQRFGHGSKTCKRKQVCARCSEEDHNDKDCKKPIKCVNCGQNHPSYDRQCSRFVAEYQIQRIKVTQNLSFFEARAEFTRLNGNANTPAGRSYASAATPGKPQMVSSSTQTDIHWIRHEPTHKPSNDISTIVPSKHVSIAIQCDPIIPKPVAKSGIAIPKPIPKPITAAPSTSSDKNTIVEDKGETSGATAQDHAPSSGGKSATGNTRGPVSKTKEVAPKNASNTAAGGSIPTPSDDPSVGTGSGKSITKSPSNGGARVKTGQNNGGLMTGGNDPASRPRKGNKISLGNTVVLKHDSHHRKKENVVEDMDTDFPDLNKLSRKVSSNIISTIRR